MPIALRLTRRIDGKLLLTDHLGRADALRDNDGNVINDDREFPDTHWFGFEWLFQNKDVASLDGDLIHIKLANAEATYRITGTGDGQNAGVRTEGYHVELVDSKLLDPPPIDEKAAAVNRAAKEARAAGTSAEANVGLSTEGANPGQAVVRDDAGTEVPSEVEG